MSPTPHQYFYYCMNNNVQILKPVKQIHINYVLKVYSKKIPKISRRGVSDMDVRLSSDAPIARLIIDI